MKEKGSTIAIANEIEMHLASSSVTPGLDGSEVDSAAATGVTVLDEEDDIASRVPLERMQEIEQAARANGGGRVELSPLELMELRREKSQYVCCLHVCEL